MSTVTNGKVVKPRAKSERVSETGGYSCLFIGTGPMVECELVSAVNGLEPADKTRCRSKWAPVVLPAIHAVQRDPEKAASNEAKHGICSFENKRVEGLGQS
jgi:hypothetical protein